VRLDLPTIGLSAYKGPTQRARVVTEAWALANLYCVNCASPQIDCLPHNTPAIDFVCPSCRVSYQLKSRRQPFGEKIVDAGYKKMREAIRQDVRPNLVAMQYDAEKWLVRNLLLIPGFALSDTAIQRRRPLGPRARRAGWVGCNILLGSIPADARLSLIEDGKLADPAVIRRDYKRIKNLAAIDPERRGWTLDVLAAVRSLGKESFTLSEAYSLDLRLARLHPGNRHVRDKIRQQLQILRDAGLLTFLGRGNYRL
jgi:type II restriction enzyme